MDGDERAGKAGGLGRTHPKASVFLVEPSIREYHRQSVLSIYSVAHINAEHLKIFRSS